MKLSVFTTITDSQRRGDLWRQASDCYEDLADEVVVVDGTYRFPTTKDQFIGELQGEGHNKVVLNEWPKEFMWDFIGQQFQRGYEACTGDWVIHADLDFIFHEDDFDKIRNACVDWNEYPALTFNKRQFILPDRYNVKSRLVLAVNKRKFGDRIKFNSGSDLCQPSLDGNYISTNDVPNLKIPFYNYEKLLKTKEQIMEDQGRMERAYFRYFGQYQMGSNGTDEDAFQKWYETQKRKLKKPHQKIDLYQHPKYMQDTIEKLKPHQFGHSMFGYKENSYI